MSSVCVKPQRMQSSHSPTFGNSKSSTYVVKSGKKRCAAGNLLPPYAQIAQSVEHSLHTRQVTGSIPVLGTTYFTFISFPFTRPEYVCQNYSLYRAGSAKVACRSHKPKTRFESYARVHLHPKLKSRSRGKMRGRTLVVCRRVFTDHRQGDVKPLAIVVLHTDLLPSTTTDFVGTTRVCGLRQ